MKKLVLLFVIGTAFFANSQTVTENKVTMNYIQLPTNVIAKQYTFYSVVLAKSFETANEDSLLIYQSELESASTIYDSELTTWKSVVKSLDRTYLSQMAIWEKQLNAGTVTPEPKKPIYPAQPTMRTTDMPQLHNDIQLYEVENAVKLEGFTKGAGGAVITLDILPISSIEITEKKSGSGTKTKYNYVCNYVLPIGVKIEAPGQGAVLQTIILNESRIYKMKSFDSKYEHQLWLFDNKEQFWNDLEKYARTNALKEANIIINDASGFPVKSRIAEVYTIKKYKEHSYADLTNAYTIASQGYAKIANSRDANAAKPKLLEAIASWKKILEESNPADKKSRINSKVTALLQCNIAEAYIWLSEFDEAEKYLNLIKAGSEGKFKRRAKKLQIALTDRRLRWNSYFN